MITGQRQIVDRPGHCTTLLHHTVAMDTTNADVYREVQKIFLNSQSILLLNNDLENKNFTSDIYMTPEDRETKENTCVNEVTSIMVTYQSLEEQVLRLENSVHGPVTNQQDILTRVKLAKRRFALE